MKRTLPALLFGFFVACGGSSEVTGEQRIRTTVIRSVDVVLDTTASSTGKFIHGPGIAPNSPDGTGEIKEFGGYRTDSDLVFRIEVTEGFSFATDWHQIGLLNVTFNGKTGNMVLINKGDPSAGGNPFGVANFFPFGANPEPSGIEVTQWMEDPDDLHFFMSVPLAAFTFPDDDDTNSVFAVKVIIERGALGGPNMDETDVVNVDFVDLP